MAIIHISEAEAVRDLGGWMARVDAGDEVLIERGSLPAVSMRRAEEPRVRLLSESLALAKEHAKGVGDEPRMDPDFAADLEEIIRNRKPWNPPAWE